MIPFGDDVSVKSLTDLDFIGLGTRPALWVDGVLTAPTSSSFLGSIGAQASLGYTPVNKAGDTMSGALSLPTLNVGHSQVTQGGTAAISEGAEVLLVRAQYLIGEIEIFWNGAANRVERMLIDVSSLNYYDGEVLSITRYVSYQNAGVFGTVRLRQDAGSTMRYLTVTVQNLNGGTAGISVVVRAMTAVAYTFGEALPGGTTVLKSITTPSRADHLATTGNLRLVNLTASRMLSLDGNQRIIALDAAGNRSLIGAAALDSPAFTGVPTAPTASAGTNTTQLATTAFVRAELAALIASAPGALDTLDELAAALGDDPNFATTVTTSIAGKVSKAGDSMTGELTMANDGLGLTLYGAARIYKKSGTGLVTRLHSGNVRMQVENNAGVILGTYWDSGNLASPIQGSGSAGKIPKFATSSTLGNSLLDDTGTEIVQSSGLYRVRNANLSDPALVFTKGADTASAFVGYMSGLFEWGPGGTTLRDTNQKRLAARVLGTDNVYKAGGGFRSTGYDGSALSAHQDGPGIEVHYDSAGSSGSGPRARVLAYDRTAAARIALAIDGSPIDFYANGVLKARINSAGDLSLDNLTASRALVSDGSKNIVASATTAAQIGWLSTLTSNVQTQLDGKAFNSAWTNQTAVIATGAAAYFNDVAAGDLAWRFGDSTKRVRLGVFDGAGGTNGSSIWLATGGAGFSGFVQFDALSANTVLGLNGSKIAYSAFSLQDPNFGTTFEGTSDPFSSRESHGAHGGVRTWNGVGPFNPSALWYNVVDVRHRNGFGDGANGYGGQLVWGMASNQTRMAFRSRAANGTPTSWTEVWTNANLASPATEAWANSTFQPKEDQRLRTTDYVGHAGVYATDFVFGANSVATDGQITYWEDAPYTEVFTSSGTMQTAHAIIDADSTTVVLDLPSAPRSGWGSPYRPILTISVPKLRLMGTSHSIRHPDPSGVIKGLNLNNNTHHSNRSVTLNYCGVYTVTMVSQYIYCISPFYA